jgi:uncharacterized membrane protein YkvA (DUF1232 family)
MKSMKEKFKEMLSIEGAISLVGVSAGMGYFLAKLDFIPDTIPVLGYVDDAAVVISAFFLIGMATRKVLPMLGMGKKKGKKRK